MHELTLAQGIVRTAVAAAGEAAGPVTAIAVEVGALSSANPETLAFCLRTVLDERGLAGAELRMSTAAAVLLCECGRQYEAQRLFEGCPACGGFARELVSGQDVTIQYVEVEDGED